MGDRINIRKIAELSGCSASTVSRVLSGKADNIQISEKTRQRILDICREQDYFPSIHASRFFSREARVIGFIIPDDIPLEDDNLARSMNAVYMSLRQTGYRFLPIVYDKTFEQEKAYLTLFKRKEIDAAIIWGVGAMNGWLEEMRAEAMPFMLLTNRVQGHPSISCDDAAGMRELTEYCRSRGARRLACVTLPAGDCAARRLEGFLSAAKTGENRLFSSAGITIEDGENLTQELLDYRPDAIVCCNDRVAIGVQKGLLAAGQRMPQDLLLTGADNIELSCYCPVPLTTFDQMARVCAERCVTTLLAHLRERTPLESAFVPPRVILRTSA